MNARDELVEELVCQCLQARADADPEACERVLGAQPPELRAQVEAMLGTLDRVGLTGPAPPRPHDAGAIVFGPYLLLERLGAGSMGVVYRVRDPAGHERALKLLQPGLLPVRRARLRFEREIQALRELDHPGICPILDSGEVDGVPFLVMPLLTGESLQARFARGPADEASRQALLAIVEQVATALHHAHERGFVHRDVKPANILVGVDERAIVLDFGLARLDREDAATLSQSREVIGAPAYMAPEQIADGRTVDRRADVYALGAVLYEGLTGRCPYEAATRESLYRRILTGDAIAPSRFANGLSASLDVVCMTALARDPHRRYQTAADLAADVVRVRSGQHPLAKLPGSAERTLRWMQRNPLPTTLVLLLTIAVVGVLVQATHQRRIAARDRARVLASEAFEVLPADPGRAEELALQAHALAPEVLDSLTAIEAARAADREEFVLTGHTEPVTDLHFATDGEHLVSTSLDGTARIWRLRTGAGVALPHDGRPALLAAFAPDGKLVVTASNDGTLRAWESRSGAKLWQQPAGRGVQVLRWSPDGRWLFAGGVGGASLWTPDGERRALSTTPTAVTAASWLANGEIAVATGPVDRTAETQRQWLRRFRVDVETVETTESREIDDGIVALHPRPGIPDRALLVGTSGTAHLWQFDGPVAPIPYRQPRGVVAAGWDGEGERAFTIAPGGVLAFWTAEGAKQREPVQTLAWVAGFLPHPRHSFAAVSGGFGVVQLRSFEGAGALQLGRRRLQALPIAFSADGQRLAATGWDHTVRVWSTWRPSHPMFFAGDVVRAAVWAADGEEVVTAGHRSWSNRAGGTGVVRRWKVATGELIGRPLEVDGPVTKLLADAKRGRLTALFGTWNKGRIRVVSSADGELREHGTALPTVGLSRLPMDGQLLADGRIAGVGEEDGIFVFDLDTGALAKRQAVVPPQVGPSGPGYLQAMCATADGATIWCGGSSCFLHRFDRGPDGNYSPTSTRQLGEFIRALEYVDDGSLLLGFANGILQRLLPDGTLMAFPGHRDDVSDLDWKRVRGELVLASGDFSGSVRLWRGDGTLRREIRAHTGAVWSVRFSPDGERLLTGSADGTARIWPVSLDVGK